MKPFRAVYIENYWTNNPKRVSVTVVEFIHKNDTLAICVTDDGRVLTVNIDHLEQAVIPSLAESNV